MLRKINFKKFGLRFLFVNLVFFVLKMIFELDLAFQLSGILDWFYYISTVFFLLFTWETSDWLIRRNVKSDIKNSLSFLSGIRILGINMAIVFPISTLIYYITYYQSNLPAIHFNYPTDPNHPMFDPDEVLFQFQIDMLRAAVIEMALISLNLFYHALQHKKEIEHKLNVLEKEVSVSRYKSLKSQISPHFLFNSLNTLTSLMYEDRDLASDFVSRLASCYRYVLDNREEDLVSLEKELNFLDSFIFMMNVRHEGALSITTDIAINSSHYTIPTLSLQMLVENALKHNYFSKEKPMKIHIFSKNKTGLVVQNTFRKRNLEEESTKLGIKNIQKRFIPIKKLW